MATHVHLLSALLTAADRRFLQDPPGLLDFVAGTTPTHPLLLPTLRNASLQQYIHSLLSLSQQASEPSPNVPVRVLRRRASELSNATEVVNEQSGETLDAPRVFFQQNEGQGVVGNWSFRDHEDLLVAWPWHRPRLYICS